MGGEGFPMHMASSSDATTSEPPASSWSNLGSDKRNDLVLIFLYVLQGKSGKSGNVGLEVWIPTSIVGLLDIIYTCEHGEIGGRL